MARKVGDDCLVVEWQAEPVETQTPALSRWTKIFSPSTYSNEILEVLGKRFVGSAAPFSLAFGVRSKIVPSNLFRSVSIRSCSSKCAANSQAAPSPTIFGTAEVP